MQLLLAAHNFHGTCVSVNMSLNPPGIHHARSPPLVFGVPIKPSSLENVGWDGGLGGLGAGGGTFCTASGCPSEDAHASWCLPPPALETRSEALSLEAICFLSQTETLKPRLVDQTSSPLSVAGRN